MRSKGQLGSFGEDLVSLTVIVLALAGFFIFVNTLFTAYVVRNAEADVYRRGWLTADLMSTAWAYTDSSNVTHSRLLDIDMICTACPPTNLSIKVKDLRKNKELCTCGTPTPDAKVARLPAAIRYNLTKTHPAIIEVRLRREGNGGKWGEGI